MTLDDDPRWRRFMGRSGPCPCCGNVMQGIFDISYDRPISYDDNLPKEPNSAFTYDRNILTEDFCILDEHRFVRCILPLPIENSSEQFAYGVWGTVKPEYFPDIVERFDDGTQGAVGPYFSWLSNRVYDCPDRPVKSTMYMQNDRKRPILMVEEEDHPLFTKQRDGITFDELLDIYAACGHDMRPHLSDA